MKTVFEAFRQMLSVRSLASSEEKFPPSAFAEAWLPPQKRATFAFALVQPGAVEAVPRHAELARKICKGLSVPEIG